ncbi:hypothetical protein D3C81_1389710 [compost metagenome]
MNSVYRKISHFSVIDVLLKIRLPAPAGHLLNDPLEVSRCRVLEPVFMTIGAQNPLHGLTADLPLDIKQDQLAAIIRVFGVTVTGAVLPGVLSQRSRGGNQGGLDRKIRGDPEFLFHQLILRIGCKGLV